MLYSSSSFKRKLGLVSFVVLVSLSCPNHGFAMEKEPRIGRSPHSYRISPEPPIGRSPHCYRISPEQSNDPSRSEEDSDGGILNADVIMSPAQSSDPSLLEEESDGGILNADVIMSPAQSSDPSLLEEESDGGILNADVIESIGFSPEDNDARVTVRFSSGARNQLTVNYDEIKNFLPERERELLNTTFSLYEKLHTKNRVKKFKRKILYNFLYNGDESFYKGMVTYMEKLKCVLERHTGGPISSNIKVLIAKRKINDLIAEGNKSNYTNNFILQCIIQKNFQQVDTKKTSADALSPVLSPNLYSARLLLLQNRKEAVNDSETSAGIRLPSFEELLVAVQVQKKERKCLQQEWRLQEKWRLQDQRLLQEERLRQESEIWKPSQPYRTFEMAPNDENKKRTHAAAFPGNPPQAYPWNRTVNPPLATLPLVNPEQFLSTALLRDQG